MKRFVCLSLALVLSLPGCLAVQDAASWRGPRVYGGIRMLASEWDRPGHTWGAALEFMAGVCLVLDVPLSLALDTAMLPVSLPYSLLDSLRN